MRASTAFKTLQWFALLLLIAAAAAGAFGWWMWRQADEKLLQAIIARQRELAPEWDVEIPRAHFDWSRRIHIYDVTIQAQGQAAPVLRLPEIVVTIDRERFRETQEVLVQKVRLINPEINLTRHHDGSWNWQSLLKLPKSERPWPEFEIERGRIIVRLEQSSAGPADSPAVASSGAAGVRATPAGEQPAPRLTGLSMITIDNCNLRLVPAARRQYVITGGGRVNDAGQLVLRGRCQLDAWRWNVDGSMHDVTTSGELLRLAAGASPELRRKLRQVDAALRRYRAATHAESSEADETHLVSTADPDDDSPTERDAIPDFGLRSMLDVDFRIGQAARETEPDFRMVVALRQGQLDHDALPFPLRDLEGSVYWDNRQIVLRRLTAKNGLTQVSLSGRFERLPSSATPGSVDLRVSKLALDERLRLRLPPLLARQFDFLEPAGEVDLAVTCVYDGAGEWAYRDVTLTTLGCAVTNQRFPYTVTGLVGTVRQQPGGDFAVKLEGRAGRRPVVVNGRIKQPGPEAEARFDVWVSRLPIDDRFREACPPDVRQTLAAMRAEGAIDAAVVLYRPPGPAQPFEITLAARLHDCAVEVDTFPYRVSGLSGRVDYRSGTKLWHFRDLRGAHGEAALTGEGVFRQDRTPETLELMVAGEGLPIDSELERALPDALRRLWADLNPSGRADVTARFSWSPGGAVAVAVPRAEIYGGHLKLASFPWLLTDVAADLSYINDRVEIRSISGRHEETQVRGTDGYAVAEADGGWQVRFEKLNIDDLTPDRRFRETLPPDLRSLFEELDPRGQPLSLEGMAHLRGGGPDSPVVTAAWDVSVYFTGARLNVGTELKDLHGRLKTSGTWDGRRAQLGGELDFDSVYVFDYQFTEVRGPFGLADDRLEFGSLQALYSESPALRAPVGARKQITARAIGGLVSLNGTARLGPRLSYELRLALRDGRLEQYARQYLPRTRNLAGVMNGDVALSGRGPAAHELSGRGRLRISPAALYELPVIARLLKALNTLAPPDKTAFKYADLEFDIEQSQFRFRRIDLVGEAISLRGRGSVGFDGQVRLDFYSMLPRTRLPIGAIPGVNTILGEVGRGWVGVKVRGKASDPQAQPTAVPVLDEALREFLRAFEGASSSMAPRLMPASRPRGFAGDDSFPPSRN